MASKLAYPYKLHRGKLHDRCGLCSQPLKVIDRKWEDLKDPRSVAIASNYCDQDCFDVAQENVEDVMQYQQARKQGSTDA